MKKILMYLLTLLCISLFIAGCSSTQQDLPQGGIVKEPEPSTSGEPIVNEPEPSVSEGPIVQADGDGADAPAVYIDDEPKYALKDNLKSLNEAIEFEGISYKVNSAVFTKDLDGIDPGLINYFSEEHDAKGTLTGSQSYAILNLTIKNVSETIREELVNKPFVLVKKDDLQILETGAEARYNSNVQEGQDAQHGHHYILKPGDEVTLEEIFILEDEQLTDELYFLAGWAGDDYDNAQHKFIHMEAGRDETTS